MTGGMLLALALLQAIVAAPPPAGTPQPPATIFAEPAALFIAACDANGDGRVTQAELTVGIVRSYATAEGAASGSIGYIAFADWAQAWLGDRNALPSPFEVDRDGDNLITLAELQARFAQFFARFDRDKDGMLTRAELITIRGAPAGDRYGIRKKK